MCDDLYGHVKIHMGKKNIWSRFPELISVIHLWRSPWLCEAGSSDVDPDKGGPCHGSECSSALALCGALGKKKRFWVRQVPRSSRVIKPLRKTQVWSNSTHYSHFFQCPDLGFIVGRIPQRKTYCKASSSVSQQVDPTSADVQEWYQ